MTTRSLKTRLSRAPWGLTGFLILLLIVESGVSSRALDRTSDLPLGVTYASQALRGEARDSAFIVVGDSLLKIGVSPGIIERRTGRKAFNLAIAGAPAPLTYYMLERSLSGGRLPSAIVVDFKATQLQPDPLIFFPSVSAELSLSECFDLARTIKEPSYFVQLLLNRELESLRDRWQICEGVRMALQGKPINLRPKNMALLSQWTANRGTWSIPKNPNKVTGASADQRNYVPDVEWYCHPLNAVFIKRFLDLCEKRGVHVYWIAPPIDPGIQAQRDARGLDTKFTRMLRNAVDRYPGLTVVDGRHSAYPVHVFFDGAHLDVEGGSVFSEALSAVLDHGIGKTPEPDRWLELPLYSSTIERVASLKAGEGSRIEPRVSAKSDPSDEPRTLKR